MYLIGYGGVGLKYINWLLSAYRENAEKLVIMYDVNGHEAPAERELNYLRGYKNSKPVRIGNGAHVQLQQDVYGIIIDAIYFLHKHIGGVDKGTYEDVVRHLVNHVCGSWKKPDHGIWEVRTEPKCFLYSDLWCWAALNMGVRIARHLGYDEDVERWKPVRKAIKKEILTKGWSRKMNAFKMCYECDELDAASWVA